MTRSLRDLALLVCVGAALGQIARTDAWAQEPGAGQKWAAVWAASPHGPYPIGNPSAQPDLSFALHAPENVARDQTFRMMVRPDRWGRTIRIRFTNVYGTAPVTFDDVFAGLQGVGGNVASGTNRPATFDRGKTSITIAPGASAYTDAVDLPFIMNPSDPLLAGRRLAVSFHVAGTSGTMTWHAKALTTSYLSGPGTGSHGRDEHDASLPFTTTSWYFIDAVDVVAPSDTVVIACFGDSITDGTASTLNGDDRWPDVLSQRLHDKYGSRVSVVNAGIGGNRIIGPVSYTAANAVAGGPSALDRLDRDVLGLSGLSAVIWFEGINDLAAGDSVAAITAGLQQGVTRLRARGGLTIIGATVTTALGNTGPHGSPAVDASRQAVNAFIRDSRTFDKVIDFDPAVRDPAAGGLKPAYQPNSTTGGAGDKLHPNRAGYQAMGAAADLEMFAPLFASRRQ